MGATLNGCGDEGEGRASGSAEEARGRRGCWGLQVSNGGLEGCQRTGDPTVGQVTDNLEDERKLSAGKMAGGTFKSRKLTFMS